jgi:hypothetical protein
MDIAVRLYGWLLNSPAYLSLSCPARAILVEVTRLYNGRMWAWGEGPKRNEHQPHAKRP